MTKLLGTHCYWQTQYNKVYQTHLPYQSVVYQLQHMITFCYPDNVERMESSSDTKTRLVKSLYPGSVLKYVQRPFDPR